MSYQTRHRMFVERQIARYTIKGLLTAGFSIIVNDGEDEVLPLSTSGPEIFTAMFSTDEDTLFAVHPNRRGVNWVRFIYGNDGPDVISDYTCPEKHLFTVTMEAVNAWVEACEEAGHFPEVTL